MTQPSGDAMKRIFRSIVDGRSRLNGTAGCGARQADRRGVRRALLQGARDLKPIPAKSHYTFNLRDVSKVVQGVLMMKLARSRTGVLAKLWAHEALRVFCDRLIDDDDRKYFQNMVVDAPRCSSRWASP